MKICYVLPKFTRQPIGGYKMVFEYANRLADRGHEVSLLFLNDDALRKFKVPRFVKNIACNYITSVEPKWFPLNPSIKKYSNLKKGYLKTMSDQDVVVATGIQTVEEVKDNFVNSRKYYYIQGYENWNCTDDYVKQTYGYGFKNVVVSTWLKKIVDEYSLEPSKLIKNPLDIDIYKRKILQSDRKNHSIGLLYHEEECKGVKYAIEVIYKLKERYPDLEVDMFGMFPRPENLPEWFNYKRGASQMETVEIYNKVQVFLCATIEEGYGLTGLEAMSCGACLVSTAYKGVLEYAKDGYNAYLAPVKDVDALYNHVVSLFEDDKERERISDNGVNSVKDMNWKEAVNKLEVILQEGV